MKWAIIILVMMSLVGSMMWVMPSPRQRFLAGLRLQASRLGFQVQIVRITPPRAEGEIEAQTLSVTAYRLPRLNLDKEERRDFTEWQIFRQRGIANEGLPEGWSWGTGENSLNSSQLQLIAELIAQLPDGVKAIESTPIHFTLFWDEQGDDSTLDALHQMMQPVIEQQF